ncbi:PLP-dependent transferase [Dyadobacter luticola]|uniref:Selenocysteine synthase n=1 Tax=Dyadobacter luticola TaxID=1979387 RepID=A0A5R9L362_9BACT|nr:PLP-dependent transferase [Dyadobacter luticola]TLV02827.1 selenocysteine synthase [Dyadobacter luticola]
MKRREILKELAMVPLAGGLVSGLEAKAESSMPKNWFNKAAAAVSAGGPLKAGPQIYQSIGVEPIINCRGTFTIIGASIELPEVRQAMEFACQYNVQIDELAFGVGQRLAELTGAEWGMVSAGCAAGMNEITAGIISGGNPEKLIRIPNLEGFEKTEVIIPRNSRNVYDHAIRNCGVKIITVETIEELQKAINPRTAMIYMMVGEEPWTVAAVAKIAKPAGVPVLVDAAAERLTMNPNIHLAAGASVVAYSGGKVIRGPQCAGLMLGSKDVLMSAWQASAPHHGPCRDNKIGREEVIGMLAAVEAWAVRDHKAEMRTWVSWLDTISKKLTGIDSVQLAVKEPAEGALDNATPTLTVSWDPAKLNITGQEVADELQTTKPRVAVGTGYRRGQDNAGPQLTSITIAAYMMGPGNDKIVAERIHGILTRKRSAPKAAAVMKAPAGDILGRWDVDIEFYTSTSKHTFLIEKQDGNYLYGTHKGEFATRELMGNIDGDEVRFQSRYSVPGDNVVMTFYGKLSGDTITGEIDMVEYVTAKFKAKKAAFPTGKQRINIPAGRPLST